MTLISVESIGQQLAALRDRMDLIWDQHEREHSQHELAHAREHKFAQDAIDKAAELAKANKADANEWRCFAPLTRVAAVGALAVARRWHEGTMLRLTTRPTGGLGDAAPSDRVLTVTPDHPLFSDRGWVPAAELAVGDNLIGYGGSQLLGGSQPDVEDVPPTIAELFAAAEDVRPAQRMVSTGRDLDGEWLDGYVDVVAIDRELADRLQPTFAKPGDELLFATSDEALVALVADSRVSKTGLALAKPRSGYRALANRGEGQVPLDHPAVARGGAEIASRSTGEAELPPDRVRGRGVSAAQIADGSAFSVEAYQLVSVDVIPWSEHVYDLATASGWLLADGIIVHNSSMNDREIKFATKEDVKAILARLDGIERSGLVATERERQRTADEAEDKRQAERRVSRSQWIIAIVVGLLASFGSLLLNFALRSL